VEVAGSAATSRRQTFETMQRADVDRLTPISSRVAEPVANAIPGSIPTRITQQRPPERGDVASAQAPTTRHRPSKRYAGE
jgi:hypothetical protein